MLGPTRLLLATAAVLAALPAGAQADPVCARVDVIVPGPVIGYGRCVQTPFPTWCLTTSHGTGSVAVETTVCRP